MPGPDFSPSARILVVFLTCFLTMSLSVEIETDSGFLLGSSSEFQGLHRNGSYISFQGIPYAAPPVGPLRFRDPVGVPPWPGVLDTSGGPPPACPQKNTWNSPDLVGEENCLFLNIYTPGIPSKGEGIKPVIVWIHGGYYTFGTGAWGAPDLLLESDVVFVSINYRLGIFGFMAIEGTTIQGNMGLKDQLEALRWIKRNIAQFGGDPSQVTIMGVSAGGGAVHSQVLSPLGKDEDLFQGAVAMSGTAMLWNPETANRFVERSSRRALELLCGLDLGDSQLPADLEETCLYELDTMEITDKLFHLYLNKNRDMEEFFTDSFEDNLFFAPILDPWADVPFQPEHPVTVVTKQEQKMIPFMTGVTRDEGALFLVPLWKHMNEEDNQLRKNWSKFGPIQFNFVLNKEDVTKDDSQYANMIARFYVGKDGIKKENKQDLLDMFSDERFVMQNNEFVKLHAKAPAPVYNYQFSYKGSFSFSKVFAMGDKEAAKEDFGVSHVDDLLYMFRFDPVPHLVTQKDKKVAEIYQKLIANFARFGDPTPAGTEDIPEWPTAQTSPDFDVYFDINEEPQLKYGMHADRVQFWHQIFFKYILEKYAVKQNREQGVKELNIKTEL